MKLAIISHTEHYQTSDGTIVGWGPTVNEINHLLDIFDEIYHVAMLHSGEAPASALAYTSDRINFIPIPAVGGRTILSKLESMLQAPKIIDIVSKTLKRVDCFQLRTPTGVALYLIPYLTMFTRAKGWYKYAGNWNQKHPPIGYRLQRWMLKRQHRIVTINGKWENQPDHCLTFENPCLTNKDIELGQQVNLRKSLPDKLSFCFVGRLEREKGVERIINAFNRLTKEDKSHVKEVHFVGDGDELNYFKSLSDNSGLQIIFHGFLSRNEVFEIYQKSHIFLLPSTASEGFPKVIVEALNFGCIPISSQVSSIGQYLIHGENGFILETITVECLLEHLREVLNMTNDDYEKLIHSGKRIVPKFTFDYYNRRVLTEIIQK